MFSFLVHALFAALLSSVCLALFSPFVTLRRVSYLGEALSHIAFAGIALALLLGLDLQFTTLIFVIAVALAITWLARRRQLQEANTITIFLSVSMALGIILISLRRGYSFDLASYLFGNVLLASSADLWMLGTLMTVNIGFIAFFYKELFYLSYNPDLAAFYRLPVRMVDRLFMILLAANIVITLRAAGIILVSAQLILPAATAFNLVKRLDHAVVACAFIAILAATGGFALSWWLNLPTGANIVLLEFLLYLLSLLFRPRSA
ncbi:MAG TPA: metal ABC transporter permease [Candidatus Syntrophosphaera sp.]|jgi:zinc transport system permease protein|nr:metal ABC transporter permease [Candidatus Syntrophosphaera sp.]HPW37744.1 metal ABC transporter permease [Candidatus Syntrophosphaera sp.]HPX67507.1 metal ABC transporter permease [Candidatus Syntrophosphaera sp.]